MSVISKMEASFGVLVKGDDGRGNDALSRNKKQWLMIDKENEKGLGSLFRQIMGHIPVFLVWYFWVSAHQLVMPSLFKQVPNGMWLIHQSKPKIL